MLICTHNSALPPQDVIYKSSVKDAKNMQTLVLYLELHHLEPSRGASTRFLTDHAKRMYSCSAGRLSPTT